LKVLTAENVIRGVYQKFGLRGRFSI